MTQYNSVVYCSLNLKTSNRTGFEEHLYFGTSELDDLEKRLNLIFKVIGKLRYDLRVERNVLVVFMAPEFYFRGGAFGRYDADQYNYFNFIMNWLSQNIPWNLYRNWLFCLGTIPIGKNYGPLPEHLDGAAPYIRDVKKYIGKSIQHKLQYGMVKVSNTAIVFHPIGEPIFFPNIQPQSPRALPAPNLFFPFRFIEKLSVADFADYADDERHIISRAQARILRKLDLTGQHARRLNPVTLGHALSANRSMVINAPDSHFFAFDDLGYGRSSKIIFNLEICSDTNLVGYPGNPIWADQGSAFEIDVNIGLIASDGLQAPRNYPPFSENGYLFRVDAQFGNSLTKMLATGGQDIAPQIEINNFEELNADFELLFGPNHEARLTLYTNNILDFPSIDNS